MSRLVQLVYFLIEWLYLVIGATLYVLLMWWSTDLWELLSYKVVQRRLQYVKRCLMRCVVSNSYSSIVWLRFTFRTLHIHCSKAIVVSSSLGSVRIQIHVYAHEFVTGKVICHFENNRRNFFEFKSHWNDLI